MEEITLQWVLENLQVVYSKRRTICIQIDKQLNIIVRAPFRTSKRQIIGFVEKNYEWIEKHYEKMRKKKETFETDEPEGYTPEEIKQLAVRAKNVIPYRVAFYASMIGVDYGRITIRNQKSRWGSCSGKGNLNFNCLLVKMPPAVLDYVVVHELCHRLEMNHSKAFWALVETYMPNYKIYKKWLKDNGDAVMKNKYTQKD